MPPDAPRVEQRWRPLVPHARGRCAPATVRASFDTVGAQRDRVLQAAPGAVADVVVLSDAALDQLRAAGKLAAAPVAIGDVSVSLAAPAGGALPDISDATHLRQALLAAP